MATTATPRVEHRSRRAVPVGTRTQVLGLSLLAAAPLTMFVVGVLTGVSVSDGLIFLVIGVILAVTAVLAARFGTWSKVLGIVLTVAAALGGFWLALGLLAPTSPGDFVPGLLLVLGAALSLYGGVRAIAARKRPAVTADPGEHRTRTVVLGIVALAAVASVAANLAGRTSVDAAAADGATAVDMADFAFEPATVTVDAGDGAALLVRNRDGFLHDIAIPDHDLVLNVTPGSEGLFDVSSLAPGEYTIYCTLHSDTSVDDPGEAGMAGTLVVR
jgi:plastocyanin